MSNDSLHIVKLADGDHKEFHRLFVSYHPRVKYFIAKMIKSESIADDLAQDIFVKLWVNKGMLTQIKSLDAYVFQMARNAAKDHIKSLVVKDSHHNKIQYSLKNEFLPDEEYDAQETELHIKLLVTRMPEQRRKIFKMSRYQGLRNEEIAERLQLSKKTVENHINAALADIRKGLPPLILLMGSILD